MCILEVLSPRHFVIKIPAVLLQAEVNVCDPTVHWTANVYALLQTLILTALLANAYIQFSAIIISQGHS